MVERCDTLGRRVNWEIALLRATFISIGRRLQTRTETPIHALVVISDGWFAELFELGEKGAVMSVREVDNAFDSRTAI